MIRLTIFDLATGAVIRTLSVSAQVLEGDPQFYCRDGEGVIDGHLDPRTHRVDIDTKEAIELQSGELQQIAAADADKIARAALEDLDRQSVRALRELLAPQSPKLADLEAQAAELRGDLIVTPDELAATESAAVQKS